MIKHSNPEIIHVIGTDASGIENLSQYLQKLIFSAERISGPKRLLDAIPKWWETQEKSSPLPEFFPSEKSKELISWLKDGNLRTIVLTSGDPLWFGIGRYLIEKLPQKRLKFHPSPTSLQLAFSRIGRPWQDASWVSLHGRDMSPLIEILQKKPKTLAILTDPNNFTLKEIQIVLNSLGMKDVYSIWLFEQLGHQNERITQIKQEHQIPKNIHPLNLIILINENISKEASESIPFFGIDDDYFIQYEDRPGLITKKEVRIQILSELNLPEVGVLWDIGAGVGSIGLEALRLRPNLKLMSVESRVGGKDLIKANAVRLGVNPRKIFDLDAISLLNSGKIPSSLSKPDRVILGGGGKQKSRLLIEIIREIGDNGVIVIPLVTIESLPEMQSILQEGGYEIRISQIHSMRGVPLSGGTRMFPMNPVFILSGRTKHQRTPIC